MNRQLMEAHQTGTEACRDCYLSSRRSEELKTLASVSSELIEMSFEEKPLASFMLSLIAGVFILFGTGTMFAFAT